MLLKLIQHRINVPDINSSNMASKTTQNKGVFPDNTRKSIEYKNWMQTNV